MNMVFCQRCRGLGVRRCMCGGRGYYDCPVEQSCSACHGRSYDDYGNPCNQCDRGRVVCQRCHGSGRVDCPHQWNDALQSHVLSCDDCQGQGQLSVVADVAQRFIWASSGLIVYAILTFIASAFVSGALGFRDGADVGFLVALAAGGYGAFHGWTKKAD